MRACAAFVSFTCDGMGKTEARERAARDALLAVFGVDDVALANAPGGPRKYAQKHKAPAASSAASKPAMMLLNEVVAKLRKPRVTFEEIPFYKPGEKAATYRVKAVYEGHSVECGRLPLPSP